ARGKRAPGSEINVQIVPQKKNCRHTRFSSSFVYSPKNITPFSLYTKGVWKTYLSSHDDVPKPTPSTPQV
ncbi:hypothetical protein V8V75_07000, partial [Peribacillus frigoritolerans]|uniref:hypothetical protein n=1 Tax=Peribacillus frigoritolerans TaxID=450367 RepID=UPI0030098708